MRERARRAFANFATMLPEDTEGIRLLGTSGTVTTLASVHLALPSYDRRAVDGLHVPIEAMQKISAMIAGMDYDERSACRASARERADLVVAGCAILEAIIEIWPAKNLGIADRGIREGILRSLMARDGWHIVKRVKTAKGRKVSSTRWLERQLNDPYVQRAKAENYRSRAAYKLLELDETLRAAEGRQGGGRPRHCAGRLEPGRAPQDSAGEGRRHRPAADRPDRRRHHPADGFHGR